MSDRPKPNPPVGFGSNDFPKVRFAVALITAFGAVRGAIGERWQHGLGPDDPSPTPDPFAGLPPSVRRAVDAAAGYLAEGYEAERESKAESNRNWKETA